MKCSTVSAVREHARLAGFMYLFTIAAYLVGAWLTSHELAFGSIGSHRLGLLLILATSWATVLLAGALYAVLRMVDPIIAIWALMWRIGEATLGALVVALRFAALTLDVGATGTVYTLMEATQAAIFSVTTLFFTAGSILFFWLFLRSRFIPRWISAFGLMASVLFAFLACANLLQIKLPEMLRYAWAPMLPAEVITGAWLLVRGVNLPPREQS